VPGSRFAAVVGATQHDRPAGPVDEEAIAARIWAARRDGWLLEAEDDVRELPLDAAYRVQTRVLQRWLGAHPEDRVVGWKLGYTSQAMREQMGVAEPNLGPLLSSMLRRSGQEPPAGLRQPRVEPEVALVVGEDVTEPLAPDRLRAAVLEARPALEIVDSTWVGYRFTLAANTADLSSAAGVVLGDPLPRADRLVDLPVELRVDGRPVAAATGAAAMGDPLTALGWLVDSLTRTGTVLRAGSVVLTGGLTAAHPLRPGSVVEATFGQGPEATRISVAR